MKKCTKCNQTKELSEFAWKSKKDGLRQPHCKECHKKYSKQHYWANKEHYVKKARVWNDAKRRELLEMVNSIKSERGCKYCDEDHPCCLDMHHLHSKDEAVSAMVSRLRNSDLILKEIEKCEVVCSNCHRKLHAGVLVAP